MIQKKIGKNWFHAGRYRHCVALGFKIDRFGFDIDLFFFFIGIEW